MAVQLHNYDVLTKLHGDMISPFECDDVGNVRNVICPAESKLLLNELEEWQQWNTDRVRKRQHDWNLTVWDNAKSRNKRGSSETGTEFLVQNTISLGFLLCCNMPQDPGTDTPGSSCTLLTGIRIWIDIRVCDTC